MIYTVVGILRRGDKFLIAERPVGKPYSGYWEFPGGKIEANESSEDALKRELHEELGITVLSAHHWFDHTHRYPDKTVHLAVWLIDHFHGEPHSKENQQLAWTTLADMPARHLLDGNWPIIQQMQSLFKKDA